MPTEPSTASHAHEFSGREVLITGGTGALGTAVVSVLLERGASLVLPVFDAKELERFDLRDHPSIRIIQGVDLRDDAAVRGLYEPLRSLWASIHIAGGFAMAAVEETTAEAFDSMMSLNARTCFLCCREATQAIRRGKKGGRIVNVAARAALQPTGGMLAYSVSKAAVASITQALAQELADEEIWVNAVVPSTMDTPANRQAMPSADPSRWASVHAVAETIAFLASPRNGVTRGALVPVYGRTG